MQGFTGVKGHDHSAGAGQPLRHRHLGAFKSDGSGVEGEPVETCSILRGEGLETIERTFLIEHLCVSFQRKESVEAAGSAAA